MKKVRINLRGSNKKWSFSLYESLEDYVYMSELSEMNDISFHNNITLNSGEFLEIEWIGVDYCHVDILGILLNEKDSHVQMIKRCDNVRIGKCIRKLGSKGFDYITCYTGWIQGDVIPWNPRNAPSHLKVIELKGRFKPRIDFSELFESNDDIGTILLSNTAEDAGIC